MKAINLCATGDNNQCLDSNQTVQSDRLIKQLDSAYLAQSDDQITALLQFRNIFRVLPCCTKAKYAMTHNSIGVARLERENNSQ